MTGSDGPDPPTTFDWTEFDSLGVAVVAHVAEELGVDVQSIDPLYESVDPDALESILARRRGSRRPSSIRVEFGYQEFRIVLRADGSGYVVERDVDGSANTGASDSASCSVDD